MGSFVLILTLIIDGGKDGQGGVTSVSNLNSSACQSIGKEWVQKVNSKSWGAGDSFYMCKQVK